MGSVNANVKVRELQIELREAGFVHLRQNGSHECWRSPDDTETIALFIHGGEAGPKNTHSIRKAIDRATIRRLHSGDRRDSTSWSTREDIPRDARVDVLMVESVSTTRTNKLFGTADLCAKNAFHYASEDEWLTGVWPTVLVEGRRRRRCTGAVLRIHHPSTWTVLHTSFPDATVAEDGEHVLLSLSLLYSGPPVERPRDETYSDPTLFLTFDRKEGSRIDGTSALPPNTSTATVRFLWFAKSRAGDVLWSGWATQAEAEQNAEDAWFALSEESMTSDVLPSPEPELTPYEEAGTEAPNTYTPPEAPQEITVSSTPTPSPTLASPQLGVEAVVLLPAALERAGALLPLLDTPAVRAVTGQSVTLAQVLRIAVDRGLAALEADLLR